LNQNKDREREGLRNLCDVAAVVFMSVCDR